MILAVCALFTAALFVYVFYPDRNVAAQRVKTRLDFLEEQKAVLYDNLRDLNFEYRAGKYPEEDYTAQRAALEAEAAQVLSEMERLHQPAMRRA
ncbi:MAG TPA: hypothetical protein VE218_05625 [Acidobacteriaceae bacterium]|nr:hypothetical protein [Acidobacteriaceae bacterium]